MYLVMFYQIDYSDHSVIISKPMDFDSEENFLEYCKKVKAVKDKDDIYKYKPNNEAYENEPLLYMKPITIHPFVSDMNLEACIQFKY